MRHSNKQLLKTNNLHICFNYLQSTIDYCGLVTVALVYRFRKSFCRKVSDIFFKDIQYKLQQVDSLTKKRQKIVDEKRIIELKESLQQIEKRLEILEKAKFAKQDKKKVKATKQKLTQEKNALLKQIVFENKMLKG